MRLLVGDDHIDIVAASQTVIGNRQQAVRIGRQIDARHARTLVGDDIQKAGILVCEAVVILPPDSRGNQQVEGSDIRAPGQLTRFFQPFGVLVEHRIDDMDEGFVRGQESHVCRSADSLPASPPMYAR